MEMGFGRNGFATGVFATILLSAAAGAGATAAAQRWNDPRTLDLVERASERRALQLADTALEDYRARAHGYLTFLAQLGAGFPEPLTFSLRARRALRSRRGDFDVVHDNQCLGYGILGIARDGLPVVGTVHHPITVDRAVELAAHEGDWRKQLSIRRWYGFVRMQKRVARRLPRVLTVSESSAGDIASQMGVRRDRLSVVPVGVDTALFRPLPHVARVPGRLMTTASADVPLKGLIPLLEALAKVRTERDAELVIVGQPRDGSPQAMASTAGREKPS